MAVAVEALPAAAEAVGSGAAGSAGAAEGAGAAAARTEEAPWRAISSASGHAPAAGRRAASGAVAGYRSVSTPSATARTITKLLWATTLGLIVLEIAAQATGQTWSFNLPAVGKGKPAKSPYQPLYQQSSQSALVFTGVLPQQTSDTNLSNRSGGNLAGP